MVGVKTNRIYEDCTKARLARETAGKPWHWEFFERWRDGNGNPIKLKVENETGKVFTVWHTGYYIGKVQLKDPGYRKAYLLEKEYGKYSSPDWDYKNKIWLTDEEAVQWI